MKIESVKDKLSVAISKAGRITSKNLTLPVLSCLLLETNKNFLKIKATNLDLGVEIMVPVKTEIEGVVAVPAQVINNFLNNLDDNKSVTLEKKENTLEIRSESSVADIKTFPVDDFPTIPQVENGKSFKIQARDFLKGLKAVLYSSSTSSVKPELASVYIYSEDENVVFVATDSFRLAEKKIKTKNSVDFGGILLPYKNAADIVKLFEDIDDQIEIKVSKNQISVFYSGLYVVSRVIDGVFPDYKQIIPKEHKTQVIVLKQDIINSLKLSNIFSDSFNQINLKVVPGKRLFQAKTKNLDVGENTNRIDATTEGEEIDINFNHRYITDCLSTIDSDSVFLTFNGMAKPLVIKGVSDKSFTYLVMPMNR